MDLDELFSYIDVESIPIVLINWYIIAGKQGFSGHFVPVTGYDKNHVYIHNPGLANPKPFMEIDKKIFKKAWESKGTDKDSIIIYSKTKVL
jgi:uncharacterized protein YvpB